MWYVIIKQFWVIPLFLWTPWINIEYAYLFGSGICASTFLIWDLLFFGPGSQTELPSCGSSQDGSMEVLFGWLGGPTVIGRLLGWAAAEAVAGVTELTLGKA